MISPSTIEIMKQPHTIQGIYVLVPLSFPLPRYNNYSILVRTKYELFFEIKNKLNKYAPYIRDQPETCIQN